jgi:hypothetical protein
LHLVFGRGTLSDCLKVATELLGALSGYAWPVAVVGLVVWFRKAILGIFDAVKRHISLGASLKYGDLELRGIRLENFPLISGAEYERIAADKNLLEARDTLYKRQKNVFLVHRSKQTEEIHPGTGLPVYDLSIYLITHKNYGALNDIKRVEYYLGKYFGKSVSEFGTKYIVRNSNNGFGIRTTAYGPTLCEARVVFHDDTETIMNRYLDFEGSGYRFDPNVNAHDAGLKA